MKRLITGLIIIQFFGCEQQPSDHSVYKYFPADQVFKDGYVNKYYYHYYPDNPDKRPFTQIRYTKNIKMDENSYRKENYNAGFDLMSNRFYSVEGDAIIIENGWGVSSRDVTDTTEMNVLNNTVSVWKGEIKEPYRVMYTYGEKEYVYTETQQSASDTLINDKPAKKFYFDWNYREAEKDSVFNEGNSTSLYVQGLGFFESRINGPDYTQHMELVEQMTIKEFEKRSNHNEHRVAWIDPKNTLSDDSSFNICGHERRIADYYNSTPDGRYAHSKRAMLDTIYSNLDRPKLLEQSGRLVFRFVVNCKGEAGRFIAQGYDLDYQPMLFDPETVNHLLNVLQRLKEWRPVVINDVPQDAYFYITFNIENGEIIDILP